MSSIPDHSLEERHEAWNEGNFSFEHAKNILQRAEQRLEKSEFSDRASSGTATIRNLPKLNVERISQPYVCSARGIARMSDTSARHKESATSSESRKLTRDAGCMAKTVSSTTFQSIHAQDDKIPFSLDVEKVNPSWAPANAGSDYFGMPATNITPELLADMRLIKVRGVLDPHRHYKKDASKNLIPDYSEVGRVIEGSTEYFGARLTGKQRKRTLVEELLASEASTGRFKTKYLEIQASKSSGKKGHYKNLKAQRSGVRKS
ncbi:dTDP-fucopyranose mutase [Lecanora helva]